MFDGSNEEKRRERTRICQFREWADWLPFYRRAGPPGSFRIEELSCAGVSKVVSGVNQDTRIGNASHSL